jgi:SAM-dependent methyltransferase
MLIRGALRHLRDRIVRPKDHGEIFSRIYRDNVWGDDESVSGPGSRRDRTAAFLDDLVAALRQLEVRSLLDAACGDFNWAAPLADAVDHYTGADVVPELVAANQARHASPHRAFLRLDLTRDALPAADAVLCRDCLVHFSFADVWAAVANIQGSGARYLIATTFVERTYNDDARTGWWRTLNMQAPPFAFGTPLLTIDERCTGWDGQYRDKRLAVWPVASLPHGG